MPERIQLSRRKGWRKPENTVVVARPSKWGNPFRLEQVPCSLGGLCWAVRIGNLIVMQHIDSQEKARELAVYLFRSWMEEDDRHDLPDPAPLAGKNLACWCPPGSACHADVAARTRERRDPVNSIHCVASYPGVPSVAPCRDGHLETCTHPDDHPGCRARLAERGFLCGRHFDRLEHAYARWPEFENRYRALEGERAVRRDTAGRRSTTDGHANLAPGFLAVDEARRFLETAGGHASLELWCGTQEGAAAAVQFAAAAERAYRDVQVEERPHRLKTAACPTFDCQGVLVWSPPAWFEKPVTIRCTDCGATVSQDAYDIGATA